MQWIFNTLELFYPFKREIFILNKNRNDKIMVDTINIRADIVEQNKFQYDVFICLGVFLFLVSWSYRLFIARPLCRRLLNYVSPKGRIITDSEVDKFAYATLEFWFYAVFSICGLKILSYQQWAFNTSSEHLFSFYWWTEQPDNKMLSEGARFFYTLYASRYLSNFASLFIEDRQKDFWQMMIHHVTSLLLVVLSYEGGYVKVGLVVMALMDVNDPVLQFGKCFVYLRDASQEAESFFSFGTVADFSFAIFAMNFFITRCVMFSYIVFSSFHDRFRVASRNYNGPIEVEVFLKELYSLEYNLSFLLVLLVVLLTLIYFWFWLILKLIVKVLKGEKVSDANDDIKEKVE